VAAAAAGGLVACVCVLAGRRSIRRQHASAAGAARRLSVDGGRAPATRQPLLQRAVRRGPVRYTAVTPPSPRPAGPPKPFADRTSAVAVAPHNRGCCRAAAPALVHRRRTRACARARSLLGLPRPWASIIGAPPPAGGQERQASSRRRRPTNDSGIVVLVAVYASRAQCPSGRRPRCRRRRRLPRRFRIFVRPTSSRVPSRVAGAPPGRSSPVLPCSI